MKTAILTATLFFSLLSLRLPAADPTSAAAADPTSAAMPVEQQFQRIDVQLALQQYGKLRMAECDISVKLLTDSAMSKEQRDRLSATLKEIRFRAQEIRTLTIEQAKVAAVESK